MSERAAWIASIVDSLSRLAFPESLGSSNNGARESADSEPEKDDMRTSRLEGEVGVTDMGFWDVGVVWSGRWIGDRGRVGALADLGFEKFSSLVEKAIRDCPSSRLVARLAPMSSTTRNHSSDLSKSSKSCSVACSTCR